MKFSRLALLALFVPSVASAHIGIPTGPALANTSGQKVTFAINHGCEVDEDTHLDTLSVKIDIPAGIDAKTVRAMASEVDASPTVVKNGEDVTSVTWTRDPADLQDGDVAYYEVTMRVKVLDVPFTKIPFVITQVCRPKNGNPDGSQDVTVVWEGAEPEPSPQLTVAPFHERGWNKITLAKDLTHDDVKAYFGDALIVWKGTSAFSSNGAISMLIPMTPGVTAIDGLAAGDEIWVKY